MTEISSKAFRDAVANLEHARNALAVARGASSDESDDLIIALRNDVYRYEALVTLMLASGLDNA